MITVSDIGIQFGKRILFKEVNLYNKGRNIVTVHSVKSRDIFSVKKTIISVKTKL